MERLGGLGVHTLEELQTFTSRVSPGVRRKRHLAEHLPHSPGVYLFRDERERVLYIGTSRDLRTRVRSYFTASEMRSRMGEMVNLAASVTGIECATPLEAGVRELRLIAAHKPRYNRRSRHPEKVHWLKLTVEPWPRLSLVRKVAEDGADYLGPFASRRTAEKCLAALHEAFPIRQCSDRLRDHADEVALRARRDGSLPLAVRRQRLDGPLRRRWSADGARQPARARPTRWWRRSPPGWTGWRATSASRRPVSTANGCRPSSGPRRAPSGSDRLSSCAELVAARREADHRWAVHVVRHGRLAAAGRDPARRPRRRLGHRAAGVRRDGGRRPRPDPGSERRGVGADPALARAARRPAGARRRASGPAPSAGPPATSRCTTRSRSRAPRWSRSANDGAGHGGPALTPAPEPARDTLSP